MIALETSQASPCLRGTFPAAFALLHRSVGNSCIRQSPWASCLLCSSLDFILGGLIWFGLFERSSCSCSLGLSREWSQGHSQGQSGMVDQSDVISHLLPDLALCLWSPLSFHLVRCQLSLAHRQRICLSFLLNFSNLSHFFLLNVLDPDLL